MSNTSANDPIIEHRFLSMKEVCSLTGYSRTHIYRMERAGRFIRRRKLGPGKVGFLFREFVEWQRNLPMPDLPPEDDE
jgi:predicted DNA-binding transcriptional regulator AlpA